MAKLETCLQKTFMNHIQWNVNLDFVFLKDFTRNSKKIQTIMPQIKKNKRNHLLVFRITRKLTPCFKNLQWILIQLDM